MAGALFRLIESSSQCYASFNVAEPLPDRPDAGNVTKTPSLPMKAPKMANPHKLKAVVLLALGLMACATIRQAIQEPTVSFRDLTPQRLSLVEGDFLFNFDVHNPNALGLKLSRMIYSLKVNQVEVAKSTRDTQLDLPAKGTALMSLPVSIRYWDLFQNATDFMAAKRIGYELSGSAKVGPFTIPYRKSGTLDLPLLPAISVDSIHIDSLSLSGAALSLTLRIKNPNGFDVKLRGLTYAFTLQGRELAQGSAQGSAPVAKKGETQLNLNLDLNFSELGRSVTAILKGESSPYQLSGEMLLDSSDGTPKRIPFQSTGRIPLRARP
jgi:LEA14-like dessication related protein